MSQHNYAYGPPEGHYQRSADPSIPYPAYSEYPSNSQTTPTYPNENAGKQAFDYNRNAIPGLGLGFSSAPAEWQQQWTNPASAALTIGSPSANAGKEAAGTTGVASKNTALASQPAEDERDSDAMDEGEISEGELEDIYEPKYPDDNSATAGEAVSRDPALRNNGAVATGRIPTPQNAPDALDRGGSYSPYLSPQEFEGAEPGKEQEPPNVGSQRQPPPTHSVHHPQTHASQQIVTKSLTQARKEARDSILRLWPLNVRYQDYLNEGVDPTIVQELFRELGFSLESSPSKTTRTSEAKTKLDEHPSTNGNTAANDKPKDKPKEPTQPAVETTQENAPSESRKDRIARLLAAKGNNKPAAVSSDGEMQPASSPATPSVVSNKALSGKSKLLRQKMEALERARQAQAQKSPKLGGHGSDNLWNGTASMPPETVAAPSQSLTQIPQQSSSSQSSAPIPGLFLSPTPESSTTGKHKRPTASDLNDASEAPAKRPFAQSRQSRPFLIDVSDDDDDEAMDLDSPELKPVSALKPSSPFKIPAYQDLHTGSGNHLERQLSSPMPTPTTNSGKVDLESMNKEIEAMKRRIAEAEAKKRARLSRPASPAVSQSASPQRAASTASSIPPSDAQERSPQASAQPESQRLPKVSERRQGSARHGSRSRSRAASERLPIIEARRREQLLKLQALQSQVQRMEKEIGDSVREEERLREEAEASSNSEENEDADMGTPPPESVASQSPHQALMGDIQGSQAERSAEAQESELASPHVPSTTSPKQSEEYTTAEPEKTLDHGDTEDGADRADGFANENAFGARESYIQDEHAEPADAMDQDPAQRVDTAHAPSEEGQLETELTQEPLVVASEDQHGGHEEIDTSSDEYEPPEEQSPSSVEDSEAVPHHETPAEGNALAEGSDDETPQGVSTTTPITHPISTGQLESRPPSPREVHQPHGSSLTNAPKGTGSSFVPYETPLKNFRAYRFHPRFSDVVPGGLRSLTYSNKIDPKKPLCPDQLAGTVCPRGDQCQFQHFEAIVAPDDQILVQLGGYGDYEGEHKQEYINGLRQLLTDFRNRKIKDFKTISQSIINYRAQFRKDPTKILPLGNVSI